MKNILHISISDFGGAGVAAYRFHKSLEKRYGISSKMLVMEKTQADDSVIEVYTSPLNRWIEKQRIRIEDRVLKCFDKDYYFFDRGRYAITKLDQIDKYIEEKPDAVVLSWISRFIDLDVLEALHKKYKCKFYWHLMDMAPLTGGCHFKWGCIKCTSDCNTCPAVRFPYKFLPKKNQRKKRNFINTLNIEFLYIAPWANSLIDNSFPYGNKKKYFMPVFFDDEIFKPISHSEKVALRQKYNIGENDDVILYGATQLNEKRKGFEYFIKSLQFLQENYTCDKMLIVMIGNKNIDLKSYNINIKSKYLGIAKTNSQLSEMYKISDLFLSPILEDMGPSMIVESLLCGVPVVTFNRGVSQDICIHKENSYVAEFEDHIDVASGIKYIFELSDSESKCFSLKSRLVASEVFGSKRYSEYIDCFLDSISCQEQCR